MPKVWNWKMSRATANPTAAQSTGYRVLGNAFHRTSNPAVKTNIVSNAVDQLEQKMENKGILDSSGRSESIRSPPTETYVRSASRPMDYVSYRHNPEPLNPAITEYANCVFVFTPVVYPDNIRLADIHHSIRMWMSETCKKPYKVIRRC